ncbi:MAG: cysteine synthase A [Clostridiales bacterium]|nr:cysteine synthase A [Clostridiales bacterium]
MDALSLVGNTPLLKLNNYAKKFGLNATLLAKVEGFNLTGSIKDRVALQMILDAEENGTLSTGATIIEPTSGNTGIGLAAIGAQRGYTVIIVMPDNMSKERQTLISSYGARLVLTDGKLGMQGAINRAEELKNSIKNAIVAGQFENPSNPKAHYLTMGKEIWEQADGQIDALVCGVGTGGTISGVGKFLKEKNAKIKIIAVEPFDSPVLSKGVSGSHKIQGIGAGFIPKTLDTDIYDEVICVKTEEAYNAARTVAKTEGLLVGISSGAALHAATQIAERAEYKNKKIAVILPDNGTRYLSTDLFE